MHRPQFTMSKGDHDARRDSMDSYSSPTRSAQGTPGSYYTHMQYNGPFSMPNQQMNAQSVGSPSNAQGTPLRSYMQVQNSDAIRLSHQQQMSAQFLGGPNSVQGTPDRLCTSVPLQMSPMTGTSLATNMPQAAISGGKHTINAYQYDQPAKGPQPVYVDNSGRQCSEAQFKLMMRLQQQHHLSAQSLSMNFPNEPQHMQFQPQQISQPASRSFQPATQAKPFAGGENGGHYNRQEIEKLKRDQFQGFGRAYFAALTPEHRQRFQRLHPQQQNQEVHQQFVRQCSLKAQQLQQQQPHLTPRQQPTPQYQHHYAPSTTSMSNIATPNMLASNVPDRGFVDKNGKHYTKEEVHAIMMSQKQQHKERQIAAAMAAYQSQAQVPSPEFSGGTLKESLIGGEQRRSVSAFHTNKLSGQGAGRKRSLAAGDSIYEDGRSPKAAMVSKASDPQHQQNVEERVSKPRTTAPTARSDSTGRAATGPVRKVIATKQPKNQDATPPKRPRGRPPKGSSTNGTQAKQAPAMNVPAFPALGSARSKARAPDVIDLTQPERTQPASNSTHPRTAEAIQPPNGLDIGQPAAPQPWLHSPHCNGVSMTDLEVGSSIQDNMTNYLSELELHRRTTVNRFANTPSTPLFTDNTMSTEHANALGLPTGFDMLPIINKVRSPNYDGFATYNGNGNGGFSGVPLPANELHDANAEILAAPFNDFEMPDTSPHLGVDRDGPLAESCTQIHMDDLPDDIQMSEESALFQWEMQQQAKNRESADNWGADTYGESTWDHVPEQDGSESLE